MGAVELQNLWWCGEVFLEQPPYPLQVALRTAFCGYQPAGIIAQYFRLAHLGDAFAQHDLEALQHAVKIWLWQGCRRFRSCFWSWRQFQSGIIHILQPFTLEFA
ncbi:MAG: hypothetical protein BWY63_00672 [Chloroflexi bacterium ADurb.Bin360]|nr:MAG: hypothetical protein BWY63_00672 [Chloroflexi bacterium ADurb.Bin360]